MSMYQHLFNDNLIKKNTEPVFHTKYVLVIEEIFVVFFAVPSVTIGRMQFLFYPTTIIRLLSFLERRKRKKDFINVFFFFYSSRSRNENYCVLII